MHCQALHLEHRHPSLHSLGLATAALLSRDFYVVPHTVRHIIVSALSVDICPFVQQHLHYPVMTIT